MTKKEIINELSYHVKSVLENEEHSYISIVDKKEIYNDVMNEASFALKNKTSKDYKISQREIDRAEFFHFYNEWRNQTYVLSDESLKEENSNYKALEQMGKRAVPFIYELAKKEDGILVRLLDKIYNCRLDEPGKYISINVIKNRWFKKIEEEGDI